MRRAEPLRRQGGGDPGRRWRRRSPGRSRMRQDKLTGSLRRGGRCLKRQGGGGGGGVGTILSNVLKKRSCISRTAPRLLCTLEPGEDPRLQRGARESSVARRGWRLCLSCAPPRPGSARGPPGAGYRGSAHAGLARSGREERGRRPGRGQRPPQAGRTGCSRWLPGGPDPAAWVRSSPVCTRSFRRAVRSALFAWWASAGGYPGGQRPRSQLCSRLTGSRVPKEVWEAERGDCLLLEVEGEGSGCEGKIRFIFLRVPEA